MPEIGPMELLVVAIVALIVFGPERLPEMARKAGRLISDVRRMSSEVRSEFQDTFEDDDDHDFDAPDPKRSDKPKAGGPSENASADQASSDPSDRPSSGDAPATTPDPAGTGPK